MQEEYESIMKNDVWDVVPRPEDKVVVTSKWLYKIKHGFDGKICRLKALITIAPIIYYFPSCYARKKSSSDGCKDHMMR